MATYKLIQDIEAEDHILGPLTLRQFIFGLGAAFFYYLCFIIFVKQVYFLLAVFLPPALFLTFFAVPFGRDQPTEVWALAKLRFWFKPRRRLWNQSGIKELVTITVPKKIEVVRTDGLSKNEVESRLKALANTLDTRGWAVKNANLTAYSPGGPLAQAGSDRLLDIGAAAPEVPAYDVQDSDDILDETSNPVARQFSTMINESSQAHRKQLIDELNDIRVNEAVKQPEPQNLWFTNQATPAADNGGQLPVVINHGPASQPVADAGPVPPAGQPLAYSHLRTLQPAGTTQPAAPPPAQSPAAQTAPPSGTGGPDAAILSLANNNDLNVSTLAREAYKAKNGDEPSQDEVVISLH